MKRIVWLGTVLCLLLGCALPVSAGSVPEDLLHYDGAQIFFAEVLDCRTEGGADAGGTAPCKNR